VVNHNLGKIRLRWREREIGIEEKVGRGVGSFYEIGG
jgi:hypothetical protein